MNNMDLVGLEVDANIAEYAVMMGITWAASAAFAGSNYHQLTVTLHRKTRGAV